MATILMFVIFGIIILRSVKRTRFSSPPPNRSAFPPGKSPHPSAVPPGYPMKTKAHTTKAHAGDSSFRRQVAAAKVSEPLSGSGTFSSESENVGEIPIQIVSLDEEKKKHHGLDLSESGILNGIILSEILGPPMARRNRIR